MRIEACQAKQGAILRGTLRFSTCALLAFSQLLAGCAGGAHLFNPTRDQQGQAAKKAWAEVDVKAIVAAERTTLQQLLEAEQKTQDRVAIAYRDHRLLDLSGVEGGFRPALSAGIDSRLIELVGSVTAIPEHWEALDTAAANDAAFKAHALPLLITNLTAPTCLQLKKDPIPAAFAKWLSSSAPRVQKVAVRTSLAELAADCTRLAANPALPAFAGAFAKANQQLVADNAALTARRAASAEARKSFADAVKAHDEAVAATEATPGRAANVLKAATELERASAALAKLGDAFAIEALSEERLKSLDDFAAAVTAAGTDNPVPSSASKELKASILLPRLLDDAEKSFAEARKPLALPLLLRRAHEELNVEAVRRDIAASQAMIELDKAQMDAVTYEAEALTLARAELGLIAENTCAAAKSMRDAFSGCDGKSKQLLYSATARYLDAIGRLDGQRNRLAYARLAAEHERSLSLSEVSARQWDSLIGTMVGQIADYNAGGFKPEQFSPLINWIALFYIGAGVNK